MSLAFVFPGQGSQAPGMGKALAEASPAARAVLDEVDDALNQKLSDLMFEGPSDELTLTTNAQPALMAASLAVMRALEVEFGVPVSKAKFVAGHSLGEYSALAAAGSISISDAAKLLRVRGEAMQAAVPVGEGAMAVLLGADIVQAVEACSQGASLGICQVANDNAPGQIVISGAKAAVDAAVEVAKSLGVRKARLLPVSAPFHCGLMRPAADVMAQALEAATVNAPVVPLVANVTGLPVTDPDVIRRQLVEQVTGRVRWRECVEWMVENGVDHIAEVGSGKVLTNMLKRAHPGVKGLAINTPDDFVGFTEFSGAM